MMQGIEQFKDFTSEKYRDIPDEFRFNRLEFPARCIYLNQNKVELCELAEMYYRNYEIVGDTYVDFFEGLQLKLLMNADRLEKIMTAYANDDLLNLGNEEVTTYDVHNTNELLNSTSVNEFIDIPVDNTNLDKPTARDRSSATSKNQSGQTGSITVSNDNVTGTIKFDLINKFIDKYKSIHEMFIDMFLDCFTLREVLTW